MYKKKIGIRLCVYYMDVKVKEYLSYTVGQLSVLAASQTSLNYIYHIALWHNGDNKYELSYYTMYTWF